MLHGSSVKWRGWPVLEPTVGVWSQVQPYSLRLIRRPSESEQVTTPTACEWQGTDVWLHREPWYCFVTWWGSQGKSHPGPMAWCYVILASGSQLFYRLSDTSPQRQECGAFLRQRESKEGSELNPPLRLNSFWRNQQPWGAQIRGLPVNSCFRETSLPKEDSITGITYPEHHRRTLDQETF